MQVETQETNAQYHSDMSRQSNSTLSVLAKRNGPQLFDGYYISKTLAMPEQSESMAMGEIVHCLVLEPEKFATRFAFKPKGLDRVKKAGKIAWECFESNSDIGRFYMIEPKINRRTTAGKEEYSAALLELGDREFVSEKDWEQAEAFLRELEFGRGRRIVTSEDYETAEGCAKAILNHDSLAFLNEPAMIEKRIDFEIDGVPMRCKPDWVSLDLQLIVDVKTTQDASPAFQKSADDFGYYRQAWLYREAIRVTAGIDCRFLFACVETAIPYSVGCYEPSELMMSQGERDFRALLSEYRYRYESGDWMQDWSKGINPLDLPAWHKPKAFFE